jgi:hypothetical protein
MNSFNTVTNLIILVNSLSEAGPDALPFPHAWAVLIWCGVTFITLLVIAIPWMEWDYLIDRYPVTERQHQRNAVYRRRIRILLSCAAVISVLSAVIPLCCGL